MFTMNEYNEIGEKIRKKREEHNLTQQKLAEKLADIINKPNFSCRTIGNWESGKTTDSISIKELSALCDVLECDFHYLLNESDFDTKEQEIACNYIGLTKYAVKNLNNGKYSTYMNVLDYLLAMHYPETSRYLMEIYELLTADSLKSMSEKEYNETNHTDNAHSEYIQHIEKYKNEAACHFTNCFRALDALSFEIDYDSFDKITGLLWGLQAAKARGITESLEEFKTHFGGEIADKQIEEMYNHQLTTISELEKKIDASYQTILKLKK